MKADLKVGDRVIYFKSKRRVFNGRYRIPCKVIGLTKQQVVMESDDGIKMRTFFENVEKVK